MTGSIPTPYQQSLAAKRSTPSLSQTIINLTNNPVPVAPDPNEKKN